MVKKGRKVGPFSFGFPGRVHPFVFPQGRTRDPEMTPEETLVEFISTSASFHGVKRQDMKSLVSLFASPLSGP